MKKQMSFFDRLLPGSLQDPVTYTAMGTFARVCFMSSVFLIIFAPIWYYLDSPRNVYLTTVWVCLNLTSLVILKLGFLQSSRVFYLCTMSVCLALASAFLGERSFMWVYALSSMASSSFVVTPAEKSLKKFSHVMLMFSIVLTFFFVFSGFIQSDIQPRYERGIVYLGIWNVVYSTFILMMSVLRFQNEAVIYKGRLEQQSVTMLQHAKMSTLGEMAAGVAHEINNPLGIIQGKIEGLSSRLRQPEIDREKVLYDFEKISAVVSRIAKIVSALRTFSRNAEKDPFQSVKIENILEETMHFCSENLKLNHVEVRLSGDQNIEFDCRPTQIAQVLINLINNSFEAVQNLPEKWIEIHSERLAPDGIRLTVTDSGKGISEKIADKIMQPFFTTKEIGKGTGLGLSIAKGLVEDHNGMLSLDLNSKNTRFVIILPQRQSVAGGLDSARAG